MSSPTIVDLRHRASSLANRSIDALNSLNEVIYDGLSNKPEKINNILEDTSNISLQYIQYGIDVFNSYIQEINNKNEYLSLLTNKNKECMDAIAEL
jgi:hypothetical protein